MVEISMLMQMFTQLRSWIALLRTEQIESNKVYKEALKSIYVAANETKLYLARLNEGETRNLETEARISRLWCDSSVELRNIDHDLAERCLLKSDYWTDPEKWDQARVKQSRIDIETVFEDARKLL